jgi:hypothetical protein
MSALQRLAIANIAVKVVEDTKHQIRDAENRIIYYSRRDKRRIRDEVKRLNAIEFGARYVAASHVAGDHRAWLQYVKRRF